jgi:hypothetical protein
LLKGRSEEAHREGDRERVLRLRWPFGSTSGEKNPVTRREPTASSAENADEVD